MFAMNKRPNRSIERDVPHSLMKNSSVLVVTWLILMSGCEHNLGKELTLLNEIGERVISHSCPGVVPVTIETVPNRYVANVKDSIKSLRCDGIDIGIYVSVAASNNPSGMPMHLKITKSHRQLPSYMNPGQPVRQLVSKLGTPTVENSSEIIYQSNESEDSVTFSVQEGKIQSILWNWYID